jgi:chromate transporter
VTTPRLRELSLYFLKLGTIGFGGPIALIGYMHRDLVERRKWASEEEYRDGLALAQLAPGPLAAQLATYLGWARHGVAGASAVSIAFVLPSLLMVLLLSVAYVRFGGLPWMRGAFYGIGAAVIGLIATSSMRLARKTLGTDLLLWIIFAINAAFTAVTSHESLWILLASGSIVLWKAAHPARTVVSVVPVFLFSLAATPLWLTILVFFAQASLVVFGSGLAVLPFLYSGVVEQYHWLSDRQFLDAVAVSMITPGPVVITVAFIGYLVDGLGGAAAAALGMFLPVFLVVIVAAPFYHRVRDHRGVQAFVMGVTAAAIGALAGAVIVLAGRAIVDWTTLAICIASFAVLQMKWKVPEPLLILAAGVVGVLMHPTAIP